MNLKPPCLANRCSRNPSISSQRPRYPQDGPLSGKGRPPNSSTNSQNTGEETVRIGRNVNARLDIRVKTIRRVNRRRTVSSVNSREWNCLCPVGGGEKKKSAQTIPNLFYCRAREEWGGTLCVLVSLGTIMRSSMVPAHPISICWALSPKKADSSSTDRKFIPFRSSWAKCIGH